MESSATCGGEPYNTNIRSSEGVAAEERGGGEKGGDPAKQQCPDLHQRSTPKSAEPPRLHLKVANQEERGELDADLHRQSGDVAADPQQTNYCRNPYLLHRINEWSWRRSGASPSESLQHRVTRVYAEPDAETTEHQTHHRIRRKGTSTEEGGCNKNLPSCGPANRSGVPDYIHANRSKVPRSKPHALCRSTCTEIQRSHNPKAKSCIIEEVNTNNRKPHISRLTGVGLERRPGRTRRREAQTKDKLGA